MLLPGLRALTVCTLLGFTAAAEASTPFRDAFVAYTNIRQLEHRLRLLPFSGKEEPEIEAERRKLAAALTAARIDFHAIRRIDGDQLTAGEKEILAQAGKPRRRPGAGPNKEALDSLAQNFPRARSFTLTEWEVIREWFGRETEEAFFKSTYGARNLPAPGPHGNGETVLWVRSCAGADSLAARSSAPRQTEELRALLAKAGYKLEPLDVSPFASADDQAAELLQALTRRKGSVILLSQNEASSLVYRALDLFPGLRKNESIRAWINLNGRPYGETPPAARAPASLAGDPVDASAAAAKAESYRLYGENLLRAPPLVDGFPIVNVLSLEGPDRPKRSPRESIVPEGSTWLAPAGKPSRALPAALRLVSAPAREDFRDTVNDPGF